MNQFALTCDHRSHHKLTSEEPAALLSSSLCVCRISRAVAEWGGCSETTVRPTCTTMMMDRYTTYMYVHVTANMPSLIIILHAKKKKQTHLEQEIHSLESFLVRNACLLLPAFISLLPHTSMQGVKMLKQYAENVRVRRAPLMLNLWPSTFNLNRGGWVGAVAMTYNVS